MAINGTRAVKRREAFLSALEAGVSVGAAAMTCGASRASVYRWRERSSRFARQWDDAMAGGGRWTCRSRPRSWPSFNHLPRVNA